MTSDATEIMYTAIYDSQEHTMNNIRNRLVIIPVAALAGISTVALTVASLASASDHGALHATATLHDTTGNVVGFARLTEDASGRVHVNIKASGLTAGRHGVHIHNTGLCAPAFAAAGAHHNPLGAVHGSHAGDLPNLIVNAAGQGRLNATTQAATVTHGPLTVFDTNGSAIVIHAAEDDLVTDPTGNSGGRIACGVIVAG